MSRARRRYSASQQREIIAAYRNPALRVEDIVSQHQIGYGALYRLLALNGIPKRGAGPGFVGHRITNSNGSDTEEEIVSLPARPAIPERPSIEERAQAARVQIGTTERPPAEPEPLTPVVAPPAAASGLPRYRVVTERVIRDVVEFDAANFADATQHALAIEGVREVVSVERIA